MDLCRTNSSPAILVSNECMKYKHGYGHILSGILDSSDLFTMTCLDGDHTMTHCNPVQCEVPLVIAHATPLGGCLVTIILGKQVEYQYEAGYHLGRSQKVATQRSALSLSNLFLLRKDLLHGSVSRIIGLSRPTNGWRTGAAPDATKFLSRQF